LKTCWRLVIGVEEIYGVRLPELICGRCCWDSAETDQCGDRSYVWMFDGAKVGKEISNEVVD
jgi:hypothetical protein